ncbi:MAG: hypothetical protein GF383_04765 [Candidatus Lokiarchaeota archaeon]|nr:hypothetical protein [Candidatus Lokiarchaeota archaeon]MBD3339108.1 hypothetical protein [Candidatus Lokiarchaeota archaeon]
MNLTLRKKKVSELSKTDLLKRAKLFIFSTGLNDGASRLCKKNMKYGLAQFHYIQEKYGMASQASFISSPDETISRNSFRWNSGLGYGGKLSWGNGKDKIVFLNAKPNCCGILVGGLEEVPHPYEIIKKIDEIKERDIYYRDILINWDYGISNHFINCFETKNLSDYKLPPYIFLIHGSAPEFRNDQHGIGLYIDHSKTLKERSIKEDTILGSQYILLDSDAKEYMEFNYRAIEFSRKKRELMASELFGPHYEVICNQQHQFLKDYNTMYLGSNCTDVSSKLIDSNIFPITLRADLPAYLFKGKKSFSDTTIRNLDYKERAENLELIESLRNAFVLPHGGGYCLPDIKKVREVLEYKDQRYFVCELKTNKNRLKILRNVKDLQFIYRGRNIVLKSLQLDLGSMIARLNPIYSLKL